MRYTVTWQMEMMAKSPRDAAQGALDLFAAAPDFLVEDAAGRQRLVTVNDRSHGADIRSVTRRRVARS